MEIHMHHQVTLETIMSYFTPITFFTFPYCQLYKTLTLTCKVQKYRSDYFTIISHITDFSFYLNSQAE